MTRTAPSNDQISKRYPSFAEMMAIPEVADLLRLASAANWTSAEFQLHLHETDWWKKSTDTSRQWQVRKLTNPGQAAQDTLRMSNKIHAAAMQQGVHVSAPQIAWLSDAGNAQGWTDQEIVQHVLDLAQQGKQTAGAITATQTALRGTAADYGIPISGDTAYLWAKRIQSGQTDQKAFEEYAKNQAKLSHPYWAKQLDEGHSLRDLADPYIQIASKTLEISPNNVDLTDPKWQRALQQHDKTGTITPMSHLDWQRTLMQDQSYGYDKTNGAREAAFNMVDSLEQNFGAR